MLVDSMQGNPNVRATGNMLGDMRENTRHPLKSVPTDHANPSVAIDRIYAVLRCGLIISNYNSKQALHSCT